MTRASKALILAGVVAMLAVSPASAGGPVPTDDQYQGRVEKTEETYFGFDLAKKHGVTKVKHVSAFINYECAGGESGGPAYGRSKASLKVENGRFSGKVKLTKLLLSRGLSNASGTFDVSGKLGKHGTAKGVVDGVIHLQGSGRGGQSSLRCYSGRLDWKAKKGAHTLPSR